MNLDTITKIIHLRAANVPQHAIAGQIGVCTRTVLRVLKKHAYEFALHEIEVMETIFAKSGITHQSQVLAQASHLKQLEVALASSSIDNPNFEKLARMTQKARKLYFDFMDRAYAKLDLALEKAAEHMDLDEFEPNNDYERNSEPDRKPPFQPVMVKEPTTTPPTEAAKKTPSPQQTPEKQSTPSAAMSGKPATNETSRLQQELNEKLARES
jgi:hypothetical protein